MQMGSQQQKLGVCGVVGCHQRSILSITVQCQTIVLRLIQMLILMCHPMSHVRLLQGVFMALA